MHFTFPADKKRAVLDLWMAVPKEEKEMYKAKAKERRERAAAAAGEEIKEEEAAEVAEGAEQKEEKPAVKPGKGEGTQRPLEHWLKARPEAQTVKTRLEEWKGLTAIQRTEYGKVTKVLAAKLMLIFSHAVAVPWVSLRVGSLFGAWSARFLPGLWSYGECLGH